MRILLRILLTGLLLLSPGVAKAHVGPHLPVIVDTDVALDDVRALALLTQSQGIDLLAVVTSDGACTPEIGARNVANILRALGRPQVPVAAGGGLDASVPPWREMSETLGWSELGMASTDAARDDDDRPGGVDPDETAVALITRVLNEDARDVIYLCLGPLTNLAAVLTADPALVERIGAIYYYGSPPDLSAPSWNTARDIEAARVVFRTPLSLRAVQLGDADLVRFDTNLLESARSSETPAARVITQTHNHERVFGLVQAGHFRCWDESALLSLLVPEIFAYQPWEDAPGVHVTTGCDREAVRICYVNLLCGDISMELGLRRAVVLEWYPTDPALLREDIRELAPVIIERHGLEEWIAALLTNELHRHLGIYSLLGAKMGIRAREILGAGLDELRVISHAGSKPPLSCITDGLQAATGASLGRGMIVVDPHMDEPEAVFIKGSRRIKLRIRDEVVERIRSDIRGAVTKHGPLTSAYWAAVRRMALRYWLEMDRSRIFTETPAPQ